MLGFSDIWSNFWASNISARKNSLLMKGSEYTKLHQTYLEMQLQIAIGIVRTFTGIGIRGKGEPVDSGEEGKSF